MEQRWPVHFVAGLFHPIAPNPQRMGRKTERCGILGVPHAAPVHRLHMHAPERAKRNRTAVCTHAVAITPRPLGLVRLPVLRLPFRLFSGAISANLPHARADPPRSPDGAPTASNLPSKERVCGSSAQLPARFDTRPQHGSTRTDCRLLPRNDEVPSEILPVQQENQRARNGTRTKYQKDVQDSDGYDS
jgi:hypothetical protein